MNYIGIDPGLSGGIAILREDGSVFHTLKMPTTEKDLVEYFLSDGEFVACACLERVSASPQMGVTSAFTFGKGYGGLRMALTAAQIPFDEVSPQRWQKAMQCLTRGDKNISKRRAQELFPHEKVTHAVADSLLIAEYCRRFHKGMFSERTL